MSGNAIIVRFDTLRSIAFGSISGSYAAIGTAFTHAMRIVKIVNTCNTNMLISFDGTTTNEVVPAGGFVLYDLTANTETTAEGFFFQKGTTVYVKQESAPASGNVYVTCVYGQGE